MTSKRLEKKSAELSSKIEAIQVSLAQLAQVDQGSAYPPPNASHGSFACDMNLEQEDKTIQQGPTILYTIASQVGVKTEAFSKSNQMQP